MVTICGRGYVRKHGFKHDEKIEVKYKWKRVGFAVITKVMRISYDDLYNPDFFRKTCFASPDELIEVVKGFFQLKFRG